MKFKIAPVIYEPSPSELRLPKKRGRADVLPGMSRSNASAALSVASELGSGVFSALKRSVKLQRTSRAQVRGTRHLARSSFAKAARYGAYPSKPQNHELLDWCFYSTRRQPHPDPSLIGNNSLVFWFRYWIGLRLTISVSISWLISSPVKSRDSR